MKISVITVVFNDLAGLKKTVKSVLSQDDKNFEYIIIDGNSTDGCKEYIQELASFAKVKSEPDTGIYNAMNKAVRMAKGKYCIFMNAGDEFCDCTVIGKANKELQDMDFYVGHTIEIGEKKTQRFPAPSKMSVGHLLSTSIYHQSTFTRTQLLLKNPYREDLKIVSDWAFFFKQWLNGATYKHLNFFVSNYYLGGYSSQNVTKIEKERKRVINDLIPARLQEHYKDKTERLEKRVKLYKEENKVVDRVRRALDKSPLARDLSLIRYGIKFFIKDLF